jgi:hypothetical protein
MAAEQIRGAVPRLHQSTANTLLRFDPLQAWLEHPELGGQERDPTGPMERGSLIHGLLLGGGAFQEIDAADYRTKAAKAARDEARAKGLLPVIKSKLDGHRETAEACRKALKEAGIDLESYKREHFIQWTSPDGIDCAGTLDALDDCWIVDVKVGNAHPEKFARHVYDMGYDVQAAAYMEALDETEPLRAGRRQYIWAVVEPDPPYRCLVRPIGAAYLEMGQGRWRRAKAIWQRCLSENRWPDYTEGTLAIDPPHYILRREEEISYESEV